MLFSVHHLPTTARVGLRSGSVIIACGAYYGVIPKAAESFDNGKINVQHLLELDCKVSIQGSEQLDQTYWIFFHLHKLSYLETYIEKP